MPAALEPAPADAPPVRVTMLYGYLLGIFPVNVVHSIVHLAIGAAGIYAWKSDHSGRRMDTPKIYARALAIVYGALALLGIIPGMQTFFGLVPLHGNDVWLHAGTAAFAAYFGWRSEAFVDRRAERSDRRQEPKPVERERRLGHSDRRVPGSEV